MVLQVSRDSNLKLPKQIEIFEESSNNIEDDVAIKKALATANDTKFDEKDVREKLEIDKDFESVSKLPFNANDLIVITTAKKLSAYVIAVTEKSPKRYRGVFVNRMQNYCLDTLEYLLKTNFIRMDSLENKNKREEYQKEAIVSLELLGYVAMLALNSGCILKKQYKQISLMLSDTINLTVAWKKSDDQRWKNRH